MSEITRQEREHLKEMLTMPGFKVMQKIIDGYLAALEAGAIAVSKQSAARNRDKIAAAWTYVEAGEQFRINLAKGVSYEIAELNAKEQAAITPEEKARRRKWHTLGMIGPIPKNFK